MKPAGSPRSITLDVRPLLARGEEPFVKIMKTVAGMSVGDSFTVVTPFLPSPLIERLQADGFAVVPERAADGSWRTHFRRE